ncbi:glutathione S-transferase APIC-like [Dorcoceras hygrometricum]|uniref:Glutathione S-transferase APIC-like n=1 Tax=Dorcoceras hygrometricum TaxID=472368 RepID=A0A2Z7DE73_9LAMI|nr:glutathione S-transferase APIC-like [Dorcoceras hygrometricum]
MGATHSSQHTVPDAQHDSTRCCPTHEMWELLTPLIVANRSQQGDEVRELPARLNNILDRSTEKQHLGATNSTSAILHHLTQQRSLNKHKAESEHLPQQARTVTDAYANRLQKGDVLAHLTSFKQRRKQNPNEASQQEESNATTLTSIGAVYRRYSEKIRSLAQLKLTQLTAESSSLIQNAVVPTNPNDDVPTPATENTLGDICLPTITDFSSKLKTNNPATTAYVTTAER